MLFAKTAKAVGPQNGAWGQSYSENSLFIVLEIRETFEPAVFGREIINKLKNRFEENKEVNLQFVKDSLNSLSLTPKTHLLIAYQTSQPEVLYLAGYGEVEAWLKRNEKADLILKNTFSSSGFLKDGDLLMLVTPSFKKIFSFSEFAKLNCHFSHLKDHEEKLAAVIASEKDNSGAAVLLICFLKEEEEKPVFPKKNLLDKWQEFKKKTREKHGFSKKRKLTVSVGLLLAVLIVVSLFFGNYQKIKLKNEELLNNLTDNVSEKIAQGKALIELNPNQARKHLNEAKQIIEETIPQFKGENSKQKDEAEKLLASINEGLVLAERVFTIEDAPLFFDLSWIKENAKGRALALYKNTLLVLDSENKNIYRLFLDSKKSELITSSELLAQAFKITLSASRIFLLVKEDGKYKVIDEKLQTVIEPDEEWGEIADLASFAGNLYLLDRSGKIWKYQGTASGFAGKKNYLSDDLSLDFSASATLRIDGSVWVLEQRNIYKFTRGVFASFNLAENEAAEIADFYTDEEVNSLYLLAENAIVVFDKEANYNARYEWEKLSNASGFVVSQSLNKILLLLDGKIYALEIPA